MVPSYFKQVVTLSALALIVIFKFQNCAPSSNSSGEAQLSSSIDPELRLIDRWGQNKVIFIAENQRVPTNQTVLSLPGLCAGENQNEKIEYQVFLNKDLPELLSSGVVDCIRGGFEVVLESVRFESCEERVEVRASRVGDLAQVASTLIEPQCE